MSNLTNFIIGAVIIGAIGSFSFAVAQNPAKPVKKVVASGPVVGSIAPDFTTTGALAGKSFNLNLKNKLKNGPLVLYFFPKVFTQGCTLEAHEFAEKSAEFKALGADIIGLSADNDADIARFSKEGCRDKFAVARATPEIIKAYNVGLVGKMMTNRTSFVIGKDGRIKFIHSNMDYKDHVKLTLEAVKALK